MKSQELDVKSNLHISLKPDTETLDEVVVVAYGAAKKNSLTGSVATVKSDALEKVPTASFEKALQGLSAREPYNEAADASFRTDMDSISLGFKLDNGFTEVP